MILTKSKVLGAALAGLLLAGVGCSGLLDVESPGKIADSDLNRTDAIPSLIAGMANRIGYMFATPTDNLITWVGLMGGELWHGGSYNWAEVPRGHVDPEDTGTIWGNLQVARWTAEDGLRRMQGVLDPSDFNTNQYVARAYMLAGLANRSLGENVCQAVIDGGSALDPSVYFARGIAQEDSAIMIAGAASGSTVDETKTAAYGVRASLKAWNGDWAGAVADAQMVPASFELDAKLSSPSPDNDVTYETHDRNEYSIWNTFMSDSTIAATAGMLGQAWRMSHLDDPRAPWDVTLNADNSQAVGANGHDPMYREHKYDTREDDVPLVKGTEMLILRAEAALRNTDIVGAYTLMNQGRVVYGMAPLVPALTMAGAWADLHYERAATLWLEGRHLWDAARFYAESGPAHSDFLNGRDTCIPISKSELDSNSNLKG